MGNVEPRTLSGLLCFHRFVAREFGPGLALSAGEISAGNCIRRTFISNECPITSINNVQPHLSVDVISVKRRRCRARKGRDRENL